MAAAAADGLRSQDFSVYNPMLSERVRSSWRRVQLFANYLFVGETLGRERSVNGTKGVLRLLDGIVPLKAILELRSMENENGVIVLRPFAPGDAVMVKDRQEGNSLFPAKFVGYKSSHRVLVLVSLMGRDCELDFEKGDLVPAHAA